MHGLPRAPASSEVAYLAEGTNEVGGHRSLLGACQVVQELQICHFLIASWACSKVIACRWTCDNTAATCMLTTMHCQASGTALHSWCSL